MTVLAVVGSLVGPVAGAFQPYFPGDASPELTELREKLASQQATLARLEEEQSLYTEAQALGVVEAVQASQLPEAQQRRLALAIVREARHNKMDPLLVVAVIICESTFNAYARSEVGALGLMQVMPDTGIYLADKAGFKLQRHTNLFDAELNVQLGTAYLADLIERFGSPERALVAYNAGPTLAQKILSQEDARTRFLAGYPAKVMREFRRLKSLHTPEVVPQDSKEALDGPK